MLLKLIISYFEVGNEEKDFDVRKHTDDEFYMLPSNIFTFPLH